MASALLIGTIKSKIDKIRAKHKPYVYSLDQLTEKDFSVEFSRIALNRSSKHLYVYYCREAVSCYNALLDMIDQFVSERNTIDTILSNLDILINGWGSGKEITKENISSLKRSIENAIKSIRISLEQYQKTYEEFERYNTDQDGMIDRISMIYFRPIKDVGYRSIYDKLYKKRRVPVRTLVDLMDRRISNLDQLLNQMANLDHGDGVIGKDETYEIYRRRQNQLYSIVQNVADLIEIELSAVENFLKAATIITNVKIYPE